MSPGMEITHDYLIDGELEPLMLPEQRFMMDMSITVHGADQQARCLFESQSGLVLLHLFPHRIQKVHQRLGDGMRGERSTMSSSWQKCLVLPLFCTSESSGLLPGGTDGGCRALALYTHAFFFLDGDQAGEMPIS